MKEVQYSNARNAWR